MNEASTSRAGSAHGPAPARVTLRVLLGDFRPSWKALLLANGLAKLVASCVLAPLAGLLPYAFLRLTGATVVTDQDILFFFLRPIGLAALIAIGAAALALLVAQSAVLLTIAFAACTGKRVGVVFALKHTVSHAWGILGLSSRIVARALLIAAPFLAFSAAVYFVLLGRFDINYYLREKPPVLWLAAGLVSIAVLWLAYLLIRRIAGWVFAFPILLFEKLPPRDSLRAAIERTKTHERALLLHLGAWAGSALALSALANASLGWLSAFVFVKTEASLSAIVLLLWLFLAVWAVVNVAVTFVNGAMFALLTARLYQQRLTGPSGEPEMRGELQSVDTQGLAHTRARGIAFGAGAAILAAGFLTGAGLLKTVRFDERTTVTAHRGAAGAAPENTLAAIAKAIDAGARWVEIDVQENADGEVVVVHDSDLKKIAGIDLKISNATSRQLRQIDIGSWFGSEFRDERVPTLAQVLDACKGKAGVIIELKYYGQSRRLEERVVEIVESHGMAHDVRVMSLEYEGVQKLRALRPDWKIGLLITAAMGDLESLDIDFLAVNTGLASLSFVQNAQEHGREVFVWTVNDPILMATMAARGADSLITDEPALAMKVLHEIEQLDSAERILLHIAGELGLLKGRHVSRARAEGV
ncbi:MAG TPA: glycerophosphodiester phosphodiesterase family protein [Candidatus Hydrogenedentes bacterium]|nr:glycerophosphodiester phosphodiesterase family protein [Candidatus Hydrogenedentota bacterium]HQM48433.1 glycerophosphodiester phosphodiesterase family protein [Candidatus Hydrogenedentota bacterium]